MEFTIPSQLTVEFLEGESFVRMKEAAAMGQVHPVALEMATKLLELIGKRAARFKLGDKSMQTHAKVILRVFKRDLKTAAKRLAPDQEVVVKFIQQPDQLTFWYELGSVASPIAQKVTGKLIPCDYCDHESKSLAGAGAHKRKHERNGDRKKLAA